MQCWKPSEAKHRTANSIYEIDQGGEVIEVYDDDETGMLSMYLASGEKRWPTRTISLEDPERAQAVLDSWARRGKLVDKRTEKAMPLRIGEP